MLIMKAQRVNITASFHDRKPINSRIKLETVEGRTAPMSIYTV